MILYLLLKWKIKVSNSYNLIFSKIITEFSTVHKILNQQVWNISRKLVIHFSRYLLSKCLLLLWLRIHCFTIFTNYEKSDIIQLQMSFLLHQLSFSSFDSTSGFSQIFIKNLTKFTLYSFPCRDLHSKLLIQFFDK